jgi:hypothetical protein
MKFFLKIMNIFKNHEPIFEIHEQFLKILNIFQIHEPILEIYEQFCRNLEQFSKFMNKF